MDRTCVHCGMTFALHPQEQELCRTLDVLDPAECPDCRRQRRLLFRNFFHLYHRTCDRTGKKIISMYDRGVPFPVFELHEWWGDGWDALSYGIPVDFSRPFFEQVGQLHRTVPRMAVMNVNCENTDYCNMSFDSRNCYLVFGNVQNEDCSYGHIVWQSQNCIDCLYTYRSQYCYECIDCVQCHSLSFSRDCDNCSASMFLVHCTGCRDCFGCVGLQNKEYHIFNVPHSKEEYRKKIAELNTGNIRTIALAKKKVDALVGKEIVKNYHGFNCENVTGDYLYNCRNIHEGYDLKNCEDCLYGATLESFKDCADCNFSGAHAELCYQCLTIGRNYRCIGCHTCQTDCANLYYCDNCYGCKDCLGCVGLKNKQYCVLNKQYTEQEYRSLLQKVITQMKQSGEWGQFFPRALSPFGYNETIAQEYFPLTEEQAIARGWKWKEQAGEEKEENYLGPQIPIPDDIRETDESICTKILRCEETGKLFKIIPQEYKFYRDMKLPLPRKCFVQRQRERFALRNPRHLWSRKCQKCGKGIETTYSPERPEKVYCEECYLKEVY
ncbi:MAG: hypothetical protein PHO92_03950 [Candidatus Peribacteraceae bacterium]|nr:hypothetical protein [Candidatus Peribacteraceae bacterium]